MKTNTSRHVWWFALASAALVAALLYFSGGPATIRIGFIANLSGRGPDLGIDGRDGALLAIEDRNRRTAGTGAPAELLVEDSRQDPARAQAALARLADAGVAAIIGPMTSAMAMVLVPPANARGMVLVSPTATTDELSGIDDNFLRVLGSTSVFAAQHARFLAGERGIGSVAVAMDLSNRAYTESWLTRFREVFAQVGGQVAEVHTFTSSTDVDFRALARALLEARADGVLLITNSLDAALICQQLRKLDTGIPISASAWAATERLVELGGHAVEGILIGQFFDRSSTRPRHVAFRDRFIARFKREPGFAAVASYDATNVVLAATERDGGSDIKQSILAIGTFDGLQSTLTIDRSGDSARGMVFATVRNGRFEVITE